MHAYVICTVFRIISIFFQFVLQKTLNRHCLVSVTYLLKVCFIKNRTIAVHSYILQWFDFNRLYLLTQWQNFMLSSYKLIIGCLNFLPTFFFWLLKWLTSWYHDVRKKLTRKDTMWLVIEDLWLYDQNTQNYILSRGGDSKPLYAQYSFIFSQNNFSMCIKAEAWSNLIFFMSL